MSGTGTRTRGASVLQSTAIPRRALVALAAAAALVAPIGPAAAGDSSRTVLLSVAESMDVVAARVVAMGGQVLKSMSIADAMLVELPTSAGIPAGTRIVPDVPMKVNGARTYNTNPVPTYLETLGSNTATDGSGVTVAVVDTGVAEVPSLAGAVTHLNVTSDPVGDGYGHGTFMAGLIAGRGEFPGVAPGAHILDVKVADAQGNTSLSFVLAGLQAIADNGTAKVVNISLSSGSPLPPQFDPLTVGLNRLWRSGVTVVTSAGNDGPEKGTVTSPGSDPLLLTVGSVDEQGTASRRDDTVADFSARGWRKKDNKPEIVAPGVSLISARVPNSVVDVQNPSAVVGTEYFRGSGTSMSTAVASGAVADVLAVNPALSPDSVKQLLQDTTYKNRNLKRADGAGSGALDLGAALAAAPTYPADVTAGSEDTGRATSSWGPKENDEAAFAAFAAAWIEGNQAAVTAAWNRLAPRTQVWAARIFAMAVVYGSMDSPELEARGWAARGWAARGWAARGWASDEWLARGWAARGWADLDWAARGWAARGWADEEWAARGWAEGSWSADEWAARGWADFMWEARGWAARGWANQIWAEGFAG